MGSKLLLVLGAGVMAAACSAPEPGVPGGAASAPSVVAVIPRAEVERDLVLELTRTTNEPYEDGRNPRFEASLMNRSKTRAYPVLLSDTGSAGSAHASREPAIGFTVERLTGSGTWEVVPKDLEQLWCDVKGEDWKQDLRMLAPGARVRLPWFTFWPIEEVGDATRVRAVAHYGYGKYSRDKSKVDPLLHVMPEFAIVSAPMEMPVARPLRLELTVNRPLPPRSTSPSQTAGLPVAGTTINVSLVNQSGATHALDAYEQGDNLTFEVELLKVDGTTQIEDLSIGFWKTPPSNAPLADGARRVLLQAGSVPWKTSALEPGAQVLRVRAIWQAWEHGNHGALRRATSPWIPAQELN